MIFDKYPYTNFHEMNDDWIIKTLREFGQRLDEFVTMNSLTYADPIEYDPDTIYPANTVIIYNDTAYVSKQTVPAGVLPTTEEYWLLIFPFGDLINGYVEDMEAQINDALSAAQSQLDAAIGTLPTVVDNWMTAHPDITTTVQDGSITWLKLHNNLQPVLLAGYSESSIINIDTFEQGAININSGEDFESVFMCRTGFITFPTGITLIRTVQDFRIQVLKYTLNGTFVNRVVNVARLEYIPFVTDEDHKYRITINYEDYSNLTPADLPPIPVICSVYQSEANDLRTDLYGGEDAPTNWQDGMIYNASVSTNSTYQRTGELQLNKGDTISFTGGRGNTALPVNALTKVINGAYQSLKYYAGTAVETITYTAPVDMIVIVSTLKTAYGNDLVIDRIGTLETLQNQLDAIPAYVKNEITAAHFELASSGSVQYSITEGDNYIIKNNGASNISLSTRLTPSGATIDNIVVAAGASKQFKATGNASYIACSTACDFEIASNKTLLPFIDSTLYKFGNYGLSLPLVRFDFNRVFGDYTDDLSGVDFMANNGSWYSIMETIYAKFDSLVSTYPNYVTKVDAAEDVNLLYPTYANLGGQASGDYSATPTYKTYLYKLVDNNTYVYSSRNPKKKLFLIGATHGNETAGAFNLYLLAKNLCEAMNSDYFKLREAFDVYIVPCLNGYGMYHYLRWNAAGVDINRNYPISNWVVSGEPYVIGYTGPSPASEFETQLIVALQNKYSFDVAIDHHNYGASSSQFYTEFWYERFNALANAALADCSSVFIEKLPAYFGTNYHLFVDINNSTRPNVVLSDTMGCMAKWMYEQGLDFAATIEIGNQINYLNGEVNSASNIPKYTNDVFKVGEFTLRNQLLYYCGFVIGSIV